MLDRQPKDLTSLHPQKARTACRGGASIDVEDVVLASVRMQMVRKDKAAARRRGRDRPQNEGSGSIAEKDASATILPVKNARECLRPDHERGTRLAEAQRVVGNRQCKDEPGADGLNVEGGAAPHPEPRLHLCSSGGKGVVGSRCGDDEQIEVAAAHLGSA